MDSHPLKRGDGHRCTTMVSYNQTFVDAVRATGGNNASRTLVVQTYNTNIWHGLNYFSLPSDSRGVRLVIP